MFRMLMDNGLLELVFGLGFTGVAFVIAAAICLPAVQSDGCHPLTEQFVLALMTFGLFLVGVAMMAGIYPVCRAWPLSACAAIAPSLGALGLLAWAGSWWALKKAVALPV
jgi:hypothetical protein